MPVMFRLDGQFGELITLLRLTGKIRLLNMILILSFLTVYCQELMIWSKMSLLGLIILNIKYIELGERQPKMILMVFGAIRE